MRRLLLVVAAALVLPGSADAARFAVGVARGADHARITAQLEQRTGGRVTPLAPFAVVLEARKGAGALGVPGVTYVERLDRGRRLAFAPSDPLFGRQWYVDAVRGFDFWPQRPSLPGMRIAVVDSGIDSRHPEFLNRIAAHKSFVGGSALQDVHGHGTFVAGLIAASLGNGEGIAGMAFPAQLLVAKVVRPDGVVPLDAEARAIRWAVDNRARVINLSLGGVRDPGDPSRDGFSPLEADAVEYAIRRDVVVVAAVGNSDQTLEQPWQYASYPAALPHVLGVSAVARDGSVPAFSNRDPRYNDVAAPGDELFSTLPRRLTALRPLCELQGYSDCGPPEFRRPQGTSFAAAIASAAAVLVRASWPNLHAEQIVGVMERSASDMTPATGCRRCTDNRDPVSGWGLLDVASAISFDIRRLPALDRYEPNDDAGRWAFRVRQPTVNLRASLDYWDDASDVYAIRLPARGRLVASLSFRRTTSEVDLVMWRPGVRHLREARALSMIDRSARPGNNLEVIRHTARRAGIYFLQVRATEPGSAAYTLRIVRR